MRVLQLVNKPQRRGAEVFAFQLSEELERRGHATSIVYLYAGDGHGLPVRSQDRLLAGAEGHPFEKVPGVHPRLYRGLLHAARAFGPDVVQLNGSRTVKYGSLLRRLDGRGDWAAVYRSIGNPRDWGGGPLRRALYRKLVVSAVDGMVGVSQATLEVARASYRLAVPSAHIPRGVDPGSLEPRRLRREVRENARTPQASPVLLYVGSLATEKRLDRLLRVFRTVRARLPGAHLWLVGDGPLRGKLESLAARLRVDGGVRFLGARTDVGTYLHAAELLVLTSDTEGIPGVILEAACAGLPAVATRVGGVAECLLDGETGLLAPPADEEALTDAVLRLLSDPALREAMGRRARQWVLERFSLETIASHYLEFYRQVLAGRRAAA